MPARPIDYLREARGTVVGQAGVRKVGYNATVSSTEDGIWGNDGNINWMGAAAVVNVTSGDANDTLAGSGAQKVTLYGTDASWNRQELEVDMDGQTISATTGTTWTRVDDVVVTQVGVGGTNAGKIYVFTGTEASGVPATATQIYSTVEIGAGKAQQAFYTIPTGYTGHLTHFRFVHPSTPAVSMTAKLQVRENADGSGAFVTEDEIVLPSGGETYNAADVVPLAITGPADVMITGDSSGADAAVNARFALVLIKDLA